MGSTTEEQKPEVSSTDLATINGLSVSTLSADSTVYKDECCLSVNIDDDVDGLFISTKTFACYAKDKLCWVVRNLNETSLFLHLRQARVYNEGERVPPTKLGINVEGGFADQPYTLKPTYQFVLLRSDNSIIYCAIDHPGLNPNLRDFAEKLIAQDSSTMRQNVDAWENQLQKSKYAEKLFQVENPKKIPASDWHCEDCGASTNLWMNLSDGHIGCGRKMYSMGGGCNDGREGAALRHYQEGDGKNPLCVKLGTITPSSADVFSYAPDENDMVIDVCLAEHLDQFGISIQSMLKTERTTGELEVEQNMNFNCLSEISEGTPLSGSGLIGLRNLGNTCYMNSVVQLLLFVPNLKKLLADLYSKLITSMNLTPEKFQNNLLMQVSKLSVDLFSDRIPTQRLKRNQFYAKPHHLLPADESDHVTTRLFRHLISKNHSEFASSRQQDAEEFLSYFIERIKSEVSKTDLPASAFSNLFEFSVEDRIQCLTTKKVRYVESSNCHLLGLACKGESPFTSLQECINSWGKATHIGNYLSEETGKLGSAISQTRMKTFPPFLLFHLRRFYFQPDWTAAKLDHSIEVPEELDLEELRAGDRDPNEELMPEKDGSPAVDSGLVEVLSAMGFSSADCCRAVKATGSTSPELCASWLLEGHPDTSASVTSLTEMGFSSERAIQALEACANDLDAAIAWLFSNPEPTQQMPLDGIGKYELMGFIRHAGTKASSGHYVTHLKKPNHGWVTYNDERVTLTPNVPRDKGYIYLFRRKDWSCQD